MEGSRCPVCKENRVSSSDSSDCFNCGHVFDDAPRSQDAKNLTGESHLKSYGDDICRKAQLNQHLYPPSIPKGRKLGRKLIERSGRILNCSPQVIDQAKSLYDRVFDHQDFHFRHLKTKLALAMASLYIVCRQCNIVVTLRDISGVSRCSVSDINQCKTEIMKVFGIEINSVDLLELAEMRCEKAGFSSNITSSTLQVIKLCQRLWLTEGRNPENVFMASSFVAWQGENSAERLKTSFRSFCKLNKFVFSSQAKILVDLIQSILCDLARKIPWLESQRIRPEHIALHFQDILKLQNTLIAEALVSCPNSFSDDSDNETCKDMLDSENTQVNDTENKPSEQKDVLSDCFKNLAASGFSSSASTTVNHENCRSDDQFLKRHAEDWWLQQIISKRKKNSKEHASFCCPDEPINLDDEELGDDDIHDDQLHLSVTSEVEIESGRVRVDAVKVATRQ